MGEQEEANRGQGASGLGRMNEVMRKNSEERKEGRQKGVGREGKKG